MQSFQKDAILRQMKDYKRDKALAEERCNKILKQQETFDDRMVAINNALQHVGRFQSILDSAYSRISSSMKPQY